MPKYSHSGREDGEWVEHPVMDCNCISRNYKMELMAVLGEYIIDEEAHIESARKWLRENRDSRNEHNKMKQVLYSAYEDTAPITVGLIKTIFNVVDTLPVCEWKN